MASAETETAGGGSAAERGRAGRLAFVALMGFTLVLLLSPQSFVPALGLVRPAFLLAALAAGAHALDCLLRRRPLVELSLEGGLVFLLLAWATVTVPFSLWPGGSLALVTGMYLKSVAVFFLLSSVVDTSARLRTVAWSLTLMALPVAGTGVMNFLRGRFVTVPEQSRIFGYEAPLTANPNDLALTLNLILPLSVALLLSTKAWGRRLLLAGVVSLLVCAVVLTFSRAGFLTLVTIGVVYAAKLLWRPERVFVMVFAVAVLGALPFLPSGYLERVGTIGDLESDPTGSAQARWRDLGAALQFLAAHPLLGAGAGMNVLALNEARGDLWTEVHNVYLEYGMDLGWPGLAAFVLLLVACVRSAGRARKAARQASHGGLFHICEGIGVSLVAFAVEAFFHPAGYEFYFYYFAGLAVAARTIARGELERAREAAPAGARLAA